MIKIKTFPVGDLQVNCYFVEDTESGNIAVIDPGDSSNAIESYVSENAENIKYILLTHGHFDHIGYANKLKELTDAQIAISKTEVPLLSDSSLNLSLMFYGRSLPAISADILLDNNSTVMLGNTEIKYISTPGHTAGSGCFIIDDSIFTGDTLMRLSMGRTDFPTSSIKDMISSLNKLKGLDSSYRIYPGHDSASTLEYEKKNNPCLNGIF